MYIDLVRNADHETFPTVGDYVQYLQECGADVGREWLDRFVQISPVEIRTYYEDYPDVDIEMEYEILGDNKPEVDLMACAKKLFRFANSEAIDKAIDALIKLKLEKSNV